ncbi:enoyl-CoA hydratase [Cupriavidus sp. TA19]|nr:enoyl-CoA hydratase [Cupriavidus sp. TA19]
MRVSGRVGTLTFTRPERRNPLSVPTMHEFIDKLERLSNMEEVAVIVIGSTGNAFCSGHDLREIHGAGLEEERELFALCSTLMQLIQQIRQPVIAAVQGIAAAAGVQLVATCDLAVASDESRYFTPGVKMGLFCSTPMVAISRAIGRKRALQMLMTGQHIDAHTAAQWGLINEVVSHDELDGRVMALAEQIAQSSTLVLKVGKQAFYQQIELSQAKAYELMSETMAVNAVTCDAREGIGAFFEKRTPQWKGA